MTEAKKRKGIKQLFLSDQADGVTLEIKKNRIGSSLVITDVVAIEEFNSEKISVLTHKGRIFIHGTRFELSVYENRCVEIFGRILGLEMGYGKS